jgi:cytochrome c oxidase subunit 2
MKAMRNAIIGGVLAAAAVAGGAVDRALAEDIGVPRQAQTGFQPPTTELARDLQAMDGLLNWIIIGIVLLVSGLLAYAIWKFDARRNPTPARFTHNAVIEVIWTAVPVMILVAIAFPSLNLLYKQMTIPEAEVTIKAYGNQWFWSYEYPDHEIDFDSLMVASDYPDWEAVMASEAGRAEVEQFGVTQDTWLLATDTAVVVPVDTVVKVQTTANDVIHAWTIPSFGVKMDAIPGRLNELWFEADRIGTYYGQCSELCGSKHAYMPIKVEVVSREDFDAWVDGMRMAEGLPPMPRETRLASAE